MMMLVASGFCFFFGVARWWLCLSCWWLILMGLIFGVMGEIALISEDAPKAPKKRDWNEPKREGRYERQLKRIIKELTEGA